MNQRYRIVELREHLECARFVDAANALRTCDHAEVRLEQDEILAALWKGLQEVEYRRGEAAVAVSKDIELVLNGLLEASAPIFAPTTRLYNEGLNQAFCFDVLGTLDLRRFVPIVRALGLTNEHALALGESEAIKACDMTATCKRWAELMHETDRAQASEKVVEQIGARTRASRKPGL